ncbi:MAG: M20/M25/M40 family metallo-hydrolase [Gemmatimonadota bacterium]
MIPFERAITFAQDLIRIPSLPGQEGDLAARVLDEFEKLGFDEVWSDDVGNCLARVRGTANAPAVMLSSHLDAVDVGDAAAWEYPPFAATIDGGFLHGRGAMDIKGPLALQTYVAATFLKQRLECDVIVAHTVLEESGGWGMEYLLQERAVTPGAVIIGEATNGDVCIGHRGRAEIVVEIQGVAAHASAPERARNPIDLLPAVLPVLQRFARELASDAILGRSTIAPTALETLPRSRNVIPDRVRMVLDWRVLPGVTPDGAVEQLRAVIARQVTVPDGWRVEVRLSTEPQRTYTGRERDRWMFTPGFLIERDHPVVRAAAVVVAASTGRSPQVRPWTFATDGGHACGVHGIPCIGFAPGEERYAHTNRERIDLAHAQLIYESYPAVVQAVHRAIR